MAQFAIPWLFEYRVLARLHVFVLLLAVSLACACGKPVKAPGENEADGSSTPAEDASQTSSSRTGPVSTDIQTVASLLLGSNAEVLAFGNLA